MRHRLFVASRLLLVGPRRYAGDTIVEYVVCARVVDVFVDLVLEHPGSRGNERRDDGAILGAMHVSEEILIRDDSRSTRLPAPRLE
jgi:hypothetical protein